MTTIFPPPYKVTEKGHGRIEVRKIRVSHALHGYITFPYAQQVFQIERRVFNSQGEFLREETVYGITSLSAQDAGRAELLELNRGHWEIENRLHWVRDVTFDEDRSQIRTKVGPRTMATLRNLAISLFRLHGYPNIARARRQNSWDASRSLELIGA
ncbi:MAG: ISAs1 family transposase [Alicyclobacillus sp.]|nr:ISAs1 family transposase [Alicyclobacillus sp.]